jgi:hypothetical protein
MKYILAIIAAAILSFGSHVSAFATDSENPASAATAYEEGKDASTAIPDTAEGIWQAIDKEMEMMTKLIGAGTLENLHHHAYAVRDLFAALPDHSSTLATDNLNAVKADTKFIATLALRLDAAGDSKDKDGANANFKKLQDLLKSARANYPEATTK